MSAVNLFKAVRTVGTALPAEAIPRANELRMPGQSAEAYQLSPGMAVNGAIARAWEAMIAAHRAWRAGLEPSTAPAARRGCHRVNLSERDTPGVPDRRRARSGRGPEGAQAAPSCSAMAARNSGPRSAAFFSPTPFSARNASGVRGLCAAMWARVRSLKRM